MVELYMNTQIDKIAEKMKEYAMFHPFNPIEVYLATDGLNMAKNIMAPFQESFDFEGYDILMTLTLDTMEQKKAWHASFGTKQSGLVLPDRVLEQLKEAFLPCKKKILEIPSRHGKLVRQFLEFV